jgi:hypothetical protein
MAAPSLGAGAVAAAEGGAAGHPKTNGEVLGCGGAAAVAVAITTAEGAAASVGETGDVDGAVAIPVDLGPHPAAIVIITAAMQTTDLPFT